MITNIETAFTAVAHLRVQHSCNAFDSPTALRDMGRVRLIHCSAQVGSWRHLAHFRYNAYNVVNQLIIKDIWLFGSWFLIDNSFK